MNDTQGSNIIQFPSKTIVDAQGVPQPDPETPKEVSPRLIAMMDIALTAEMLNIYAMHNIGTEVDDVEELKDVQEAIKAHLKAMGQFDILAVGDRLLQATQRVMVDLAMAPVAAADAAAADAAEDQPPAADPSV